MTFKAKYSEEFRDKRERDYFQVEFGKKDDDFTREDFDKAKVFIQQAKDTTALKQLAKLGYLAISGPDHFFSYFRDTLFKNERNNKRLGLDVETEIENKIRMKLLKKDMKMQSGGVPNE